MLSVNHVIVGLHEHLGDWYGLFNFGEFSKKLNVDELLVYCYLRRASGISMPFCGDTVILPSLPKVKEGHTTKERRRGAHLPDKGHRARRWINYYCLCRMASAMPDLRLPSQPKLVLNYLSTEGWPGWVDLGGWLHTKIVYPPESGHPSRY